MDWSWSSGGGPVIPNIRRNVWSECIREHASRRMRKVGAELSVKEVRLAIHEALSLMGM